MTATVIPFKQRPRRDRRGAIPWLGASLGLGIPAAVFGFLRMFPQLDATTGSGTSHFYIVSAVAAFALVLALAVIRAAATLPDARTFFLAMGFVSMATIFLAHGLGTSPFYAQHGHSASATPSAAPAEPAGSVAEDYAASSVHPAHAGTIAATAPSPEPTASPEVIARRKVVGYSARLSLLVSALFFALATVDLPAALSHLIVRRWRLLLALLATPLAAHLALALEYPALLGWIPMQSERLNWSLAYATWACLGFAGWRYLQAYRLALLPLQGAMAFGMGLLAEAQWFMLKGSLWHLSWWEYHVVMFAGFAACVAALLHQYRHTGDLGAIVEGLFLRRHVRALQSGDHRSLATLIAAVAAKDSETAEHTERVGDFSAAIAGRLWLPPERLEVVRLAGRLHDVGKLGVSNRILRKPGALTEEEFEEIKLHAPRGWLIATRSRMLAEAAPIIRSHHERLDGSGYPDALRGAAIPIEARIVAVADVWDALTCDRPYRRAMTANDAAEIMVRESVAHLDPDCVQALFDEVGVATRALLAA